MFTSHKECLWVWSLHINCKHWCSHKHIRKHVWSCDKCVMVNSTLEPVLLVNSRPSRAVIHEKHISYLWNVWYIIKNKYAHFTSNHWIYQRKQSWIVYSKFFFLQSRYAPKWQKWTESGFKLFVFVLDSSFRQNKNNK